MTRKAGRDRPEVGGGRPQPRLAPARTAWPSGFLAGAFFLSGFSALIYELLWFRLLGHIFGSTATATATLLSAYLFGLGLGAWIFGKLSDRLGRRLLPVYVGIEAAIGLYGFASGVLLERGAALYAVGYSWAGGSAGRLLLARFAVSFLLVALPTTLMGGTFPLMVHLLRTQRVDTGRATGRAYAINTAGAAAGTLCLPAFLLPSWGIAMSLACAAVANFGAALLAYVQALRTRAAERLLAPRAGRPSADSLQDTRPQRVPGALSDKDAVSHGSPGPVLAPPAATHASSASARASSASAQASTASDPAAPGPAIPSAPDARREPATRRLAAAGGSHPPAAALLTAFFLSSFASLVLESVWTRHLGFFFGAQTFTFAFVLFAYLVGLFLGGAAYARAQSAGAAPATILRVGLVLAAAGVALPIPFLDRLAVPQIEMMLRLGVSHGTFLVTTGIVTLGLILVPAAGFGLVFPAVVDLLARAGRGVGASVGLTYVVNTAGTTLGALGAGFFLVPALGSEWTLKIATLLIASALALSWLLPAGGDAGAGAGSRAQGISPARRYGLPAAFLLVLLMPRWDWRFAHAQYSKDPRAFLERYRTGTLTAFIESFKIPFLEEGTEATVSVCDFGGGLRSLLVNGKPDASNVPDDMVAQRLLACIPGLFHPRPRNALVIGVGSGTTAATLMRFPLESIDAAEISPEVSEAARTYFSEVNDRFLNDRRLTLRLDDGRNFLHFRPPSSYDIIISEPSNPWMAGVSALFTEEFFAEVREKLRPGGIFCQWFHYYNMSIDHIRLLARTFRTQFPEAALFVIRGQRPTGDILIIGAKGPLRLARLPEDPTLPDTVRAALEEVGNAGSQQILSGLVATPADFADFARPGPLNTDDLPILEFAAPADRFSTDFFETLRALITSSERTFLPAGPTPAESPAPAEIAKDGFALTRGVPPGAEVLRGATVLTYFRSREGEDVARWVLLGRRFQAQREGSTELVYLARELARPDELVDIANALAGPGVASRAEALVNGHSGIQVLAENEGQRSVVVGWNCPLRKRAFFLSRQIPLASAPPPGTEIAADLAARYPCGHPAAGRP